MFTLLKQFLKCDSQQILEDHTSVKQLTLSKQTIQIFFFFYVNSNAEAEASILESGLCVQIQALCFAT